MVDWKNEFWKMLLSKEESAYTASYPFKKKHIPKKLYRYRSIHDFDSFERIINEIQTGEIYLAHPATFNDPFDCASVLNSTNAGDYLNRDKFKAVFAEDISNKNLMRIFDSEDWFSELAKYIESEHPQIRPDKLKRLFLMGLSDENKGITDIIRSGVRIACLSETNCNIPMWYHYTGNFSGVCIEYDTENISLKSSNLLFPVTYADTFIDITKGFYEKLMPADISLYMLIASHKLIDWSYEREWRIIMPASMLGFNENESYASRKGKLYHFIKPTKVILGCNIHSVAEKAIMYTCEKHGIECVKSKVTEYGLQIG